MLKEIEHILEKEKFNCSLIPLSDEIPYERLLVFLGVDTKQREQILEIQSQEQVLNQQLRALRLDEAKYFKIQFQFKFPFKTKEFAFNQVSSLVLFLNQLIDFPGLELNELNNEILYRYAWLTKDRGVDTILITTIIGLILLTLELFTPSIERLAEGELTFNQLLEEIIQIAQSMKNSNS